MDRDLAARLRLEGLHPARWSNGPGVRYGHHEHAYAKVLVCAEGGIRFGIPATATQIDLGPGDRLEMPAATGHDAVVGPAGVVCLEAQVVAGRITEVRRRVAGGW